MADRSVDTLDLRRWLDRIAAGDLAARDELLSATCGRMERLARKMLRGFPNVRQWAQTDDVLQSALLRLLRTLRQVRPADTREFFGLAAVHIRRELLDLARHFRRRLDRPGGAADAEAPDALAQAPGPDSSTDLERWGAFHEAVERLPAEEREVVGLTFYHGWTQPQIAALLGVDERTGRRRWRAACVRLTEALGGHLPDA